MTSIAIHYLLESYTDYQYTVVHDMVLPQSFLTEFQPKGGGLSQTLMDQGQTNNPKLNP